MGIKRDQYLNALINRMHNGMIKVITGIRRAGKSYILLRTWEVNATIYSLHIVCQQKRKEYRKRLL